MSTRRKDSHSDDSKEFRNRIGQLKNAIGDIKTKMGKLDTGRSTFSQVSSRQVVQSHRDLPRLDFKGLSKADGSKETLRNLESYSSRVAEQRQDQRLFELELENKELKQ